MDAARSACVDHEATADESHRELPPVRRDLVPAPVWIATDHQVQAVRALGDEDDWPRGQVQRKLGRCLCPDDVPPGQGAKSRAQRRISATPGDIDGDDELSAERV